MRRVRFVRHIPLAAPPAATAVAVAPGAAAAVAVDAEYVEVDPALWEHLKKLLLSDGDVLSDTILRGKVLSGRGYEDLPCMGLTSRGNLFYLRLFLPHLYPPH